MDLKMEFCFGHTKRLAEWALGMIEAGQYTQNIAALETLHMSGGQIKPLTQLGVPHRQHSLRVLKYKVCLDCVAKVIVDQEALQGMDYRKKIITSVPWTLALSLIPFKFMLKSCAQDINYGGKSVVHNIFPRKKMGMLTLIL